MKMKTLFLLLATISLLFSCSDSDNTTPAPDRDPEQEEPTPDANKDTEGPYEIGDYYKQGSITGIVYATSAEGMHGMIISMTEGDGLQWATEFSSTGAVNTSQGAPNQSLIQTLPNWEADFPAFRWSTALNKDDVSGWYIPSVMELQKLYNNFSGVNNMGRYTFNENLALHGGTPLSSADYWSSSECSHNAASIVNFTSGSTFCGIKTSKAKVRTVRAI